MTIDQELLNQLLRASDVKPEPEEKAYTLEEFHKLNDLPPCGVFKDDKIICPQKLWPNHSEYELEIKSMEKGHNPLTEMYSEMYREMHNAFTNNDSESRIAKTLKMFDTIADSIAGSIADSYKINAGHFCDVGTRKHRNIQNAVFKLSADTGKILTKISDIEYKVHFHKSRINKLIKTMANGVNKASKALSSGDIKDVLFIIDEQMDFMPIEDHEIEEYKTFEIKTFEIKTFEIKFKYKRPLAESPSTTTYSFKASNADGAQYQLHQAFNNITEIISIEQTD